jgi:manganese/zinc/iron transport system substrate-binding protein
VRLSKRALLASLIAAAAAAAGGVAPGLAGEAPLKVVATTGMIADAARRIGGDQVEVRALMGPGVDPHSYRQTRTDIVAMTRADIVLWHGLHLEAQMEEFLTKLGEKRHVVPVAEQLPKDVLIHHDTYASKFDPHVWMAPGLWTGVVMAVRDALTEARPGAAADFEASAELYLAEIGALDDYVATITASVAPDRRVLVTAHDAFKYFGAAYEFEVLGIQGISTESEAGLSRIAELVDVLVARDIGAVFVESSVSDRNVRALVEGAAARGHSVVIGGQLFSDAMGPDGSYEGSYIGMIDHNATLIARALGGSAPERGMLERLSAGT